MNRGPNLIVFASGSKTGGGSGFEKLVEAARAGELKANIVAVLSNHKEGGVRQRADRLGIPFLHFPAPWSASRYAMAVRRYGADFVSLSGWLKLVSGLDPRTTINIHPGPLPKFGGQGMYGHHVHEAVIAAYARGEVQSSAVSMHFVTDDYDRGPVFFELSVAIKPGDTADTLAARVNEQEHFWQARVTNLVVTGQISWNGSSFHSLRVPAGYSFLPQMAG